MRADTDTGGQPQETERRARLERVWKETTADRGRIALYIEHRDLPIEVLDAVDDTALRYHPALPYFDDHGVCRGDYPAMVARVTDVTGQGVTLQRTYLSPHGPGKLDLGGGLPAKKLMTPVADGATKGASITLTAAKSVLGVGEGIETMLAVLAATGLAVWAAVSAGGLEAVIVPAEVRSVHIWADNDHSGCGQRAAEHLAARLCSEGLTVFVHQPPRPGTDWLDEYRSAGPEALQSELAEGLPWSPQAAASVPALSDDWEAPLPLDSAGRLPPFPRDALPGRLRDMAREISQSRQVPADMPALALLGVTAAAAAGRFTVQLPTHTEPPNLYLLVAVDPGTRKTQVIRDVAEPVYEIERELCDRARPAIEAARAQHDLDQERLRHLKAWGAKLDDANERAAVQAQMAELSGGMSIPPSPPRLLVDDVTPERLAALLAENDGVMASVTAEGGIVGMMAGRYNDKGGPNLDVYLKAHSGDPLRVDRASDGGHPHILDHPALTLVLMAQPEVLTQLGKVPGGRGRGLLGRFLYSLPECGLGTRTYQSRPLDPAVVRDYHDLLWRLFAHLKPEAPRPLRFSDAALDEWRAFHDAVEERLAEDGDLRPISDWASKVAGAVARIAGILHVVDHADRRAEDVLISPETVRAAIAIGFYFIEHARAAFALMSESPDMKMTRRILRWIERQQVTEFSLRDCHQCIRTERPSDLEPGLRILEDRDIVQRSPLASTTGPGRKPSPRYLVSPYLTNRSQNSQNSSDTDCSSHLVNLVNGSRQAQTEPAEFPTRNQPPDPRTVTS